MVSFRIKLYVGFNILLVFIQYILGCSVLITISLGYNPFGYNLTWLQSLWLQSHLVIQRPISPNGGSASDLYASLCLSPFTGPGFDARRACDALRHKHGA